VKWRFAIAALLGLGLAALCTGCPNGNPLGLGPTLCDRSIQGNPPVLYCGGQQLQGWYATNPWNSGWLSWKGGQHYRLVHGLRCTPSVIIPYFAFSENGVDLNIDDGGAEGGVTSNGAGDPFGIVEVNDTEIVIGNDSCVEYWIRVVAGGCEPNFEDAGSILIEDRCDFDAGDGG
jgi:hypothetical protein